MARAAGTCKDFAAHAKDTRSELRTLKMPPGMSCGDKPVAAQALMKYVLSTAHDQGAGMPHMRILMPDLILIPSHTEAYTSSAGLDATAVCGMVQAFRRATKIKLHGDYLNSPAAVAAIAAGSRGRGEGGLPVHALDISHSRSATELHAKHFYGAIPTLQ